MMPPVIFIIPLFLFFYQLRLVNSYLGLTLAYMTGLLPFTVWMAAGTSRTCPIEIEEAARVDGASRARAFLVVLPLVMPGIITIGLLIAHRGLERVLHPVHVGGAEHHARDGRAWSTSWAPTSSTGARWRPRA